MTIGEYKRLLPKIEEVLRNVEGHLTIREARFLAMAAAWPTTSLGGDVILEIGSFKGRSTIVLCLGKSISDNAPLIAVDPLTSPSCTDPALSDNGDDV